jgi:hypothetical protein
MPLSRLIVVRRRNALGRRGHDQHRVDLDLEAGGLVAER